MRVCYHISLCVCVCVCVHVRAHTCVLSSSVVSKCFMSTILSSHQPIERSTATLFILQLSIPNAEMSQLCGLTANKRQDLTQVARTSSTLP